MGDSRGGEQLAIFVKRHFDVVYAGYGLRVVLSCERRGFPIVIV